VERACTGVRTQIAAVYPMLTNYSPACRSRDEPFDVLMETPTMKPGAVTNAWKPVRILGKSCLLRDRPNVFCYHHKYSLSRCVHFADSLGSPPTVIVTEIVSRTRSSNSYDQTHDTALIHRPKDA
jgi:hypothetical protein